MVNFEKGDNWLVPPQEEFYLMQTYTKLQSVARLSLCYTPGRLFWKQLEILVLP